MRRIACAAALGLVLSGCASLGREDVGPDPSDFQEPVAYQQAWRANVGKQPRVAGYDLQPAVVGERVYVAGSDGKVRALDAASGKRLWEIELEQSPSAGPTADAQRLIIGTREGQVVGLSAEDGRVLWRSGVSSEILAAPTLQGDLVVVHSADGRVFSLRADTGERDWIYDQVPPALTLRGSSRPLILGGELVVVGLDNGKMVGLAANNGRALWSAVVSEPSGRTDLDRMADVDADPVAMASVIYAVGYQGRVVAVDALSGRPLWQRDIGSHIGLAVDRVNVYVVDGESNVWALNRRNGASVWRQQDLAALQLTAPVVVGNYLVLGDAQGYLNWLSLDDGRLLRRESIGAPVVQAPVLDGRSLYVLTDKGLRVYRTEE